MSQAPPRRAPAAPPPQPPPAGRGGLDAQIAMGADFSPEAAGHQVVAEEQQKRFLLPPGIASSRC